MASNHGERPPLPPIDFVGLARALLERAHVLVPEWLPAGFEQGGRWYVGDLDGAPGKSCNVDLRTGTWVDNQTDEKGGDLIGLYAAIHGLNNGKAAVELMDMLGWERARLDPPAAPRPSAAPPPLGSADAGTTAEPPATPAPLARRTSPWRAITPVPRHAPKPDFAYRYHDKVTGTWMETRPVKTWAYEIDGELQGYVARFERISSKTGEVVKDTLPYTWCVDESDGRGTQKWHWRTWEKPRPLFLPVGLLSDGGALPVVVVEGEKCAQAGHQLLGHEFDFVTWPGGCKTWQLARWSMLMGRTVYLWPDCDAARERLNKAERDAGVDPDTMPLLPEAKQAGMKAMVGIGERLMLDEGCTVYLCKIPAPGAKPSGWDIADAIEEGWTPDQVRNFIRSATPLVPPAPESRAAAGLPGGLEEADRQARSRAAAGQEQAEARDPVWRDHLLYSDKGAIKAARENVVCALDGWPERDVPGVPEVAGLIAFNEFSNTVIKTRPSPWGTDAGVWEEADELLMGEWLVREHRLPSMPRGTLEEAVLMVAHRHSVHPIRDRIEGLRGQWDGEKRLKGWLARVCLVDQDPQLADPLLVRYLARAGTWFLMAMCARVMSRKMAGARVTVGPGVKFDYMLILEGPQGWGKSTVAATLGGEHFADTGLNLGEKDSYQNIQGIWIYEWGELENLSKQEVGKVKLFVSSPKDRFRATFDKRPRDYPRQVVFVGTTNEANYLTDLTGNRRFWPVRVTRPPDNEWLGENLDQLLAEAVAYVDAGERFWPNRDEQRDLFDPQQRARTVESSLEAAIRMYLYDPDQKVPHLGVNGSMESQISLTDLLTRVGYAIDKQTDVVVKKAGAVMHALGWTVRRTSLPGRPRVYVRPAGEESPLARASGGSRGPTQGHDDDDGNDIPF